MLFFIRHGECSANSENRFAGQRDDSPLTERGMLQVQEAGKEFDSRKVTISRIISSPLVRARRTAEIIAENIGFDSSNIEIDKRLIEFEMGELAGQQKDGVTPDQRVSAIGAEDPHEFVARVISALEEYAASNENVLVVSHAGVGRAIQIHQKQLSPVNLYKEEGHPNAHVVQIEL